MDISRAIDRLRKIKNSRMRKKLKMSWGENLQNSANGGKKPVGGKKQNNKWKIPQQGSEESA